MPHAGVCNRKPLIVVYLLFCNVFGAAIEVIEIENGQHGNDTYCRLCNFDETQTITARIYAKEEKKNYSDPTPTEEKRARRGLIKIFS